MHRQALENNLRREFYEDIVDNGQANTPLRGNFVGPPRRTLNFESVSQRTNLFQERTFNHNILTRSIVCPPSFPSASTRPAVLIAGPTASQINILNNVVRNSDSYKQTTHQLNSQSCSADDRFIPRRRNVNLEASNYLLTSATEKEKEEDGHYLDVFNEVKNAKEHWRRMHMQRAFLSLDVFKGLRDKRVLKFGCEPAQIAGYRRMMVKELAGDGQWPCHPRKQPHMSIRGESSSKRYRDHGAQIFRFALPIKFHNVIDWSAKDDLAAGMSDALCVCSINSKPFMSQVYRIDYYSDVCYVKWDSQGTQISISGIDGHTSIYDTIAEKIVWTIKCPCKMRKCMTASTVWAENDRHLITGCNKGSLNIMDSRNGNSIMVKKFTCEIRNVSVSMNNKYMALSGTDRLVKVFTYPAMHTIFEIEFYTTIKAMAWHPWRSNILCIGGGPGDGALSLWNAGNQKQLSYKKIDFIGAVDSMMFNKVSGELLVHWYYLDNDRLCSKLAVLSSLDHIVDAVPVHPDHRILNIIWGSDGTKLAMQHRDTLVIWDFFGNDVKNWTKYMKEEKSKPVSVETSTLLLMDDFTDSQTSLAHARRGKPLSWYTIR